MIGRLESVRPCYVRLPNSYAAHALAFISEHDLLPVIFVG